MAERRRREAPLIVALVVGAFLLRLLVRRAIGVSDPITAGYELFLLVARSFANGTGLCLQPGRDCAIRMPLYPLLLSRFLGPGAAMALVTVQAAIGASVVASTYSIGRSLFNPTVGMAAALAATLNPYAVVHDTAVQDTVLVNTLAAAAIAAALRFALGRRLRVAWVVGLALGLLVLTAARMTLLVPVVVGWIAWQAGDTWPARARAIAAVAVPIALLVGAWMWRNARVVGAPVLTTEGGDSLWRANNPQTFAHFPFESIDRGAEAAYAAMPPAQYQELVAAGGDEVAADRVLFGWGWQYIVTHPAQTVARALVKVALPVSGLLTPAQSPLVNWGFGIVYVPVHVAALVGLWRFRSRWRPHALSYGIGLAFVATTAIYWAHTSHASYLDPIWFTYAASGVARVVRPGVPGTS
jgi:4-amino-4-deoxy-L-arabinose transferase-like glycosyltransferase